MLGWVLTFQRTPVDQSTDMIVIHAGRLTEKLACQNWTSKHQSHTFSISEQMFAHIQILIIVKEWYSFKNGTDIMHSGKKRDYQIVIKMHHARNMHYEIL